MPERRRAGRRVAGILAVAVLVTAAVMAIRYGVLGPGPFRGASRAAVAAVNENSPLAVPEQGARGPRCPGACVHRSSAPRPKPTCRRPAYTETGSRRVDRNPGGACARATGSWTQPGVSARFTAACRIFDRFAVEPAPARWVEALKPLHDLSVGRLDRRRAAAAVRGLARDQPVLGLDSRPLAHAGRGANAGRMEGGRLRAGRPLPGQPRCPDPGRHRRLPGCAADR